NARNDGIRSRRPGAATRAVDAARPHVRIRQRLLLARHGGIVRRQTVHDRSADQRRRIGAGAIVKLSRLHRRLVLLASLAVVPALAVIGYTQWVARRHAMERTVDESRRVARFAADQQVAVFDTAAQMLRMLATFRTSLDDAAECHALLADLWRDHAMYAG